VSELEARTIQTLLAVPISFKGELIGVLIMTNKRTGVSFTIEDQRLLTIIAAQSAQLIRNSQLQSEALEKKRLAHQLELAQNMQIQLLPDKDPEFPDLDISAFFQAHKSVSGDYYDYFRITDNQLGVVIADVSGHGPPAALVMTLVKGILHALIHRFESPAQVLTEANNILQKIIPPDIFVTMSFLTFNMDKNQLVFANAGHTPLLMFDHRNSKSVIFAAEDCPLNTLPNYKYKNQMIKFVPSNFFLIYTDGLSESIDDKGEMFGINRLKQALDNFYKHSSEEFISKIRLEVDTYLGDQEYSDDMLIMAIKILD
jgi:sigma-B regulation protein RsbU (phosphoserine phosphatase)